MPDTWARKRSRQKARRKAVVLASRITAFAALGLSGLFITLYLLFPVEDVRVEGNQRLPDSAFLQDVPESASLPMLGERDLERGVKSNPWVKGVRVNKRWDSGMVVVEVEERNAALNARLDNGERVVVAEDGTELPGLGGASRPEVRLGEIRLGEVRAVQKVLEKNGVEVESVESVGARGVEISLKRSGEDSPGSGATAIFSDSVGGGQARTLEGLLRDRPRARYFDLRAPGRVVLGPAPQNTGGSEGESGGGAARAAG